jgi:hypothetical protein
MKRTRASAFWVALGILVLALLGISTSLVLANQAAPTAGEDTWVADVDTGDSGQDLSDGSISASSALTWYMPLTSQGYFNTFSYFDDFQNTGSGWPYGSDEFDYGYRTDGDTSKVYHFRMNTEDDIAFVTGPGLVGGNFDYTAWIRHATFEQPKKWGDEFGLLLSPTPVDPENPVINGAYTFHIWLKMGSGNTSSYQIYKWSGPSKSTRTLIKSAEEPNYITDDVKVWNTFRIKRSGDQLTFWLTRQGGGGLQLVHTLTDSSLPYYMYIGFYGAHSGDDFGTYRIEFQFDNLEANSYR